MGEGNGEGRRERREKRETPSRWSSSGLREANARSAARHQRIETSGPDPLDLDTLVIARNEGLRQTGYIIGLAAYQLVWLI